MSQLASIVVIEEFHPGQYIFFEDDLDAHFYIIDEGQIQIFTKSPDGKRVNLATLGPGECFGELALIDRSPRSASAQALTFSKVYKISEKDYLTLLSELPDWAQILLKTFSDRIKKLNQVTREQNLLIREYKKQLKITD
ncbi:MAG: cyclic nucleotide-binding domain-containing protein [Bdellovibrionaceae bacterium]|nr:cyclic nucleotide-binding domain-containing protein [Pseudobdellovibrionaceae bacterium]MDW8191137.1 cyclic nucleotide-binding domain-containing protein [Pseudobdellovibrionaceae bacterium]